jgi:hypothetical protein
MPWETTENINGLEFYIGSGFYGDYVVGFHICHKDIRQAIASRDPRIWQALDEMVQEIETYSMMFDGGMFWRDVEEMMYRSTTRPEDADVIEKLETLATYKYVDPETREAARGALKRLITGNLLQRQKTVKKPAKPIGGLVYIARSGEYHKIGLTSDFERRREELTKNTPLEITWAYLIPTSDMHKLEKTLHEKYKNKRHKGEWFNLSETDLKEIQDTLQGEIWNESAK